MTDRFDDLDSDDGQSDALASLLGQAAVWGDPTEPTIGSRPAPTEEANAGIEDAIVAAIAAERRSFDQPDTEAVVTPLRRTGSSDSSPGQVTPSGSSQADNVVPISRAKRWVGPILAGAAAAVLIIAGFSVANRPEDPTGLELALEATDNAPGASATATIADTPLGTRIILDVTDLPPAADGTYYEAWMRVDAQIGVSAGTFHLRGGDGSIELWAGVTVEDYPLFTVTIQDEAQVESSGVVVLRGLVEQG